MNRYVIFASYLINLTLLDLIHIIEYHVLFLAGIPGLRFLHEEDHVK